GQAMKTFHDHATINDNTAIIEVPNTPHPVLVERDRNNALSIVLRKIEPEQSLAIWTTGERQFARLAAYYTVGLVLLDPDPPRRMPGIVLSLGAVVTPLGHVRLNTSRSQLAFALPAP